MPNFKGPEPIEPSIDAERHMTPEFVVPNFIKPLTMKSKTPLYTRVPLEFRGTPNLFVSHPWSQLLVGPPNACTLYAIDQILQTELRENDKYVWIDIISYNQHLIGNIAYDMKAIIGDIGLLVLPLINYSTIFSSPLERLWCLWEILSAYQTKSTIKFYEPIGFRLDRGVIYNHFENNFSSVSNAKTTLIEDKIAILDGICSTFGSIENADKFIRKIVGESTSRRVNY